MAYSIFLGFLDRRDPRGDPIEDACGAMRKYLPRKGMPRVASLFPLSDKNDVRERLERRDLRIGGFRDPLRCLIESVAPQCVEPERLGGIGIPTVRRHSC